MSLETFISTHLTIDQNHIKPQTKSSPIKSKTEFYKLLEWWLRLSKSNTIGDIRIMNKNNPLVYVNIGANLYYLNADTKRSGVKDFLDFKENNWIVVPNEDGRRNKITNRLDSLPIEGLYLYKVI